MLEAFETFYYDDGSKQEWAYWEDGRLKRDAIYSKDGTKKTEYTYWENGIHIRTIITYYDDGVTKEREATFWDNGREKTFIYYHQNGTKEQEVTYWKTCLLYTSPSPRDS